MTCKSGPLHGQCNYIKYKHKRTYINIGMEKVEKVENKMCNKIMCTVDLINNNISTKPVISSTGIFVAIAKNTLYGSK